MGEGIQKTLISFDDIQFEQSTDTNQKVSKTIKDWKFIQDNFVDLGLQSGTLWCKYNLGASNGDTLESWYGDYYAWGEIEIKSNYTLGDYTYKENPEFLPLSNDIAYQTNNLMHIPTKDQIQELISLPNEWVTNYNGITGLNGRVFIGTNGNKLFIPAADCCYGSSTHNTGNYCYLWSSSLNTVIPIYAWYLSFDSNSVDTCYDYRYGGRPVRGVISND